MNPAVEDQSQPVEDQNQAGHDQACVPVTGEPDVDRALESLQGLESAPLTDHHDRLARVHEELHAALNAEHPGAGS